MEKNKHRSFSQRGFTIVELLVALLIGLLSVYAVYNVYWQFEQTNRANTSLNDLQYNGLHSLFLLEQTVNDAGAGMMYQTVFDKLLGCPQEDLLPTASTPSTSLRPVPVVIEEKTGGRTGASRLDQIVVFSGASSAYGYIPEITSSIADGANELPVPFSFKANDVLVAVGNNSCKAYRVNSSARVSGASPKITANLKGNGSATGSIINLGYAVRYHFWVNEHSILQMDQYELGDAGKWTLTATLPVASNVVAFAAQYGVDSSAQADSIVDQWLDPDTDGWKSADIKAADGAKLKKIKAIRVGIIARFDEPDRATAARQDNIPVAMKLFENCRPEGADCNDGEAITYTVSSNDGPNGTRYRYRKFETLIPLRNTVWNPAE